MSIFTVVNLHKYYESLVRRGEIVLDSDVIDNWHHELNGMYQGTEGAAYRYPDLFVQLLGYYWYVDSIHFTADWLLLGDLFCQAKNMKRKGMVMTAVVIKIGWNDVGSILIPKSCKKGSGKTVYIQKPAIIPKIILFRFRTERRLILFIFLRPHVMHFMVL